MTLKAALLQVGFSQDDINNNKHQHAVNIASPGAFSVITNTDTTATATAAAATTAATIAATTTTITTAATKTKTKKKRKRNTRRTVSQLTNHECEAQKAKKKEEAKSRILRLWNNGKHRRCYQRNNKLVVGILSMTLIKGTIQM